MLKCEYGDLHSNGTSVENAQTDSKVFKVMDKLVRENGTGSFIKRFWKNLSQTDTQQVAIVSKFGYREMDNGIVKAD